MNAIVDHTDYRTISAPAARPDRARIAELGRHTLVAGLLVGSVILAIALRVVAFAPASLRQVFGF